MNKSCKNTEVKKCLLSGKMKAFRAAREKIASVMRRAPDVNKRQGISVKSCNAGRIKGLVKQV